jgi:hypothetical protein
MSEEQEETKFDQELESRLEALSQRDAAIIAAGKQVLVHEIFLCDLVVTAVLNRALHLLTGFIVLVRHENWTCAAPLLRLQIDNSCRLFAGSQVGNFDRFTSDVLSGKRIDRMKDIKGNRLTDAHLVEELAKFAEAPWLPSVYERTSGHIHLSDTHLFASSYAERESRKLMLSITRKETRVPPSGWHELIEAFTAATDLVLDLVALWARQKAFEFSSREAPLNPDLVNPKTHDSSEGAG